MSSIMTRQPEEKCTYCRVESRFLPIIPKPSIFGFAGTQHQLIDAGKPVCLSCLEYEINEIKVIDNG